MIKELIADKVLLYIVNKHLSFVYHICSYFNKFIYCYSNNNTMYSKNTIGNRNALSNYQSLFSLIESEEFRETSNIST